jgi:hypothetical protein
LAETSDFLLRWSRLKQQARVAERQPAPALATPETIPAEAPGIAAETQATPAELPPVETLDKDSDFTPFLRADVPQELQNQALRKLWQSDPVFANLDGLVEYGEDFGAAFKLGGLVATVYRVLEGMPGPADEKDQTAAEPAPAEVTSEAEPAADQTDHECAITDDTDSRFRGLPEDVDLD